jgi:hypothetical protein
MKSAYQRDSCIPLFIAALFTTAKIQNLPSTPSKLMDKENVIYTQNGILFSHKQNKILPFAVK